MERICIFFSFFLYSNKLLWNVFNFIAYKILCMLHSKSHLLFYQIIKIIEKYLRMPFVYCKDLSTIIVYLNDCWIRFNVVRKKNQLVLENRFLNVIFFKLLNIYLCNFTVVTWRMRYFFYTYILQTY